MSIEVRRVRVRYQPQRGRSMRSAAPWFAAIMGTVVFAVFALASAAPAQGSERARGDAVRSAPVMLAPLRVISEGEALHPDDFVLTAAPARLPADVLRDLDDVIGMEARRELTPERPVLRRAVTPVRVVRRNMPVTVVYESGPVRVAVDGLALADAAAGDAVRVANARTRRVVTGRAQEDGRVVVTR